MACDTGPGNILSDNAAKILLDKPMDKNGEVASRGKVNESLMKDLKAHPYFQRAIPRSLWPKTDFSKSYCEKLFSNIQI